MVEMLSPTVTTNGSRTEQHDPYVAYGTTGLVQYAGRIAEEYLRAWRGTQKKKTIQEMHTDAIIAASLLIYEMLIRQVTWDFAVAGQDNLAQEHAAFARQVWFEDHQTAWTNVVSEILTMLSWGFAPIQMVLKRRQGDNRDPALHSRFNDGRIGLSQLFLHGQETVERWFIDTDHGGRLEGFEQQDTIGGKRYAISLERILLFRTRVYKQNPEGSSLLRGAYLPWYHKKNYDVFQGIGIERDTAGLHVIRIPKVVMEDPAYLSIYNDYKKMAVNLRNDEQAGLVLPSDRDDKGHFYYDVERIQSVGGQRQIDIGKAIDQKNLEMLLALMTDILVVGHEKIGSLALHSSKTSLLSTALGGIMDIIVEGVHRQGMPRLWRVNGFPPETMPRLAHGDIEQQNLEEVANFILRLSQAGFQVDDLEPEVRRRTGFPMRIEERV